MNVQTSPLCLHDFRAKQTDRQTDTRTELSQLFSLLQGPCDVHQIKSIPLFLSQFDVGKHSKVQSNWLAGRLAKIWAPSPAATRTLCLWRPNSDVNVEQTMAIIGRWFVSQTDQNKWAIIFICAGEARELQVWLFPSVSQRQRQQQQQLDLVGHRLGAPTGLCCFFVQLFGLRSLETSKRLAALWPRKVGPPVLGLAENILESIWNLARKFLHFSIELFSRRPPPPHRPCRSILNYANYAFRAPTASSSCCCCSSSPLQTLVCSIVWPLWLTKSCQLSFDTNNDVVQIFCSNHCLTVHDQWDEHWWLSFFSFKARYLSDLGDQLWCQVKEDNKWRSATKMFLFFSISIHLHALADGCSLCLTSFLNFMQNFSWNFRWNSRRLSQILPIILSKTNDFTLRHLKCFKSIFGSCLCRDMFMYNNNNNNWPAFFSLAEAHTQNTCWSRRKKVLNWLTEYNNNNNNLDGHLML